MKFMKYENIIFINMCDSMEDVIDRVEQRCAGHEEIYHFEELMKDYYNLKGQVAYYKGLTDSKYISEVSDNTKRIEDLYDLCQLASVDSCVILRKMENDHFDVIFINEEDDVSFENIKDELMKYNKGDIHQIKMSQIDEESKYSDFGYGYKCDINFDKFYLYCDNTYKFKFRPLILNEDEKFEGFEINDNQLLDFYLVEIH